MVLVPSSFRSSIRTAFAPGRLDHAGKRSTLVAVCAVLAVMVCGAWSSSAAQTAQFAYAQSTIPTSAQSNAYNVAVDASRNVYVVNTGLGTVLKETPTASGTYTESTVVSGLSFPGGIAVDANGNLYILNNGSNQALKETRSGGTYSQSTITGGLSTATGIAVDGSGNVYITENAYVLKETPSGSSYIQSQAISGYSFNGIAVDAAGNLFLTQYSNLLKATLSSGTYNLTIIDSAFGGAIGVAVSSDGIVYVADGDTAGSGRVVEESPTTLGYTPIVLSKGALGPTGIAVDWQKNLYVTNNLTNQLLKLATSGVDFGSEAIGVPSSSISLAFTFSSGGTIALPAVVTQGASGLDFTNAGTGTCTTNGTTHTYNYGDLCTVDVIFTPKEPGARAGVVFLADSSGKTIATAFVRGSGTGPRVSFIPGSLSRLSLPGVTSPTQIAADPLGNLYIAQAVAAFSASNAVYKETWNGSGYVQSTVASATDIVFPMSIAVDALGNVYVLDEGRYDILKFAPKPDGTYTRSIFDTANTRSNAVAVDGSGNVYFTSGYTASSTGVQIDSPITGYYGSKIIQVSGSVSGIAVDASGTIYAATSAPNQTLVKETPSNGSYVESTVAGDLPPSLVAVDGLGDIYVAASSSIYKESPSGGSYARSMLASPPNGANGVAVDGAGNVYLTSTADSSVWKLSFDKPAALHFAATTPGQTSSNSPQTATIQNSGNAALSFVIPASGYNPALPPGFTLRDSLPTDCPEESASSGTPGSLAAGATCDFAVSYSPQSASDLSGWMTITDDALNSPAPTYTSQSIALAVAGAPITPVIRWATPTGILYGTALGLAQLNAQTLAQGTFAYSPAAGTVLGVGTHTLTVTFTPSDGVAFTSASASVNIVVTQATPAIQWATPAAIDYGTALSATQLDASTPVAGTFNYSPSAGTVLTAGSHTLSVTFIPSDTVDYTTATASVTQVVNRVTPTITWPTPAAITYGTPLSATQLNATASAPGSFIYSPAAGTVLTPGYGKLLTATFIPTDTADFNGATASVYLSVNPATPSISWATPAAITYGTALSATQLNATASVPGTFYYSYSMGSVLRAGSYMLTAYFYPTDSIDYSSTTATTTLVVNKATPAVTWATPAAINYGTALGAAQLNATASTGGTFAYSPPAGTVLGVGSHTLTATFTPSDALDYKSGVTGNVTIQVNQATPTITWATPSAITYGTALGTSQLNASSAVAGVFSYSPAAGSVLGAGSHAITATFTPTDTTDYTTAIKIITLVVNQATPAIAWPTPTTITYGMALGAAQLNASSTVAGSFVYFPAAGTVLTAGAHTITVTFTPTDAVDYTGASGNVTIVVNPVAPTLAWATPSAIPYGTALGAPQLNASSAIAGTFVYSPSAGTVLSAGSHTLTATFTPTDTTDYTGAIASVTLVVSQATPTITWLTPAAITYGTALGAAQLNASSTVAGSFTYLPAAGTVLSAGSQTLAASFTPVDTTNYTTATAMVALTVNKAAPGIALVSSANPAYVSNPVIFTATLTSTASVPTGTVSFYDATTLLGTGTLSAGGATYTTSALTASVHPITAVYSGDSNFATVTSSALSETVENFTIGLPTGGATTVTASPGGQAVYTFAVSPPSGGVFAGAITFTVTGLPTGGTATFSPTTIPSGAGATNVTMTVSLPSSAEARPLPRPFRGGALPVALGLILLPFAGRLRKASRRLNKTVCLMVLAIAGLALAMGLTACGGSSSPPPRNYPLTITGTSGSLSNTFNVTLIVQ